MKTYWTSGVMIEVTPKPGDKLFYAKDEADAAIAELEKVQRRYEFVRTLNVPQFQALFVDNLKKGVPFDRLVDEAISIQRSALMER